MEKLITLEMVRDQWQACYTKERLVLLYDHPCTVEEVLTRQDGEWVAVPIKDRFWTVLREELIDAGTLRLFACWCARQCLPPESDKRSWAAVEAGENYVAGKITLAELESARSAARSAYLAARSSAYLAAESAARSAARSAAESAAQEKQVAKLLDMLKGTK